MRRAFGLVILFSFVPALGCGGSDSVALSDLKSVAQEASCEHSTRCGFFPDIATCKSSSMGGGTEPLIAAVNAGRIRYDGKAAKECLDGVRDMGCNISDQTAGIQAACVSTFKGIVAVGGACSMDEECLSGECHASDCSKDCCPGTCAQAETQIPVGGDCSADGSCVQGAYCQESNAGATCVARIKEGEACVLSARDAPCVEGAYCTGSGSGSAGTCRIAPAEGETCAGQFRCNSLLDYCDEDTLKCTRKRAVGAACSDHYQCVDYATCEAGVCKARKKVGEACEDQVECLGALECNDEGICSSRPADLCL
jgi:hypothetical protein